MTEVLNDILMITFNRPAYTRRALGHLLDTCDEQCRVWLWQNGSDAETLRVLDDFKGHRRVFRFHHSSENVGQNTPLRWIFESGTAPYVTKVDDDCLMPNDWLPKLRSAHEDNAKFGAVGCWRFPDELFHPELASRKIRRFAGGHQVMLNAWIEGSGFVLKRLCIDQHGPIAKGVSFPQYCIMLARHGWINGWYFPFLFQEHFDHPWSKHTMFKVDEDLQRYAPVNAKRWGVATVSDYAEHFRREAIRLQATDPDPRQYSGWQGQARRLMRQVQRETDPELPHLTPAEARIKRFRDRHQLGLKLYYRSRWVNAPFVSDGEMALIGGAERSGTTLLRATLDSHPDIAMGPESWLFVYKLDLGFLSEEYRFPLDELEAMRDASSGLAEFVSRFADRCREASGKRVWGEKSPQNVTRLGYIWEHFPRARFVHIIRDGRDVACSLRTHPKRIRIGDMYYPTNIRRPIEECIAKWVDAVSAGIRHRGDPRYLEIRYEDLVADYDGATRRIVDHLGVVWSDELLARQEMQGKRNDVEIVNPEVRGPLYSKAVGRWRRELSASELAVVEERAGDLLRGLGYFNN